MPEFIIFLFLGQFNHNTITQLRIKPGTAKQIEIDPFVESVKTLLSKI